MDWKDGLKLGAVLIGSGVATSIIIWYLQSRMSGQANATARAAAQDEVQKIFAAAASKIQQTHPTLQAGTATSTRPRVIPAPAFPKDYSPTVSPTQSNILNV